MTPLYRSPLSTLLWYANTRVARSFMAMVLLVALAIPVAFYGPAIYHKIKDPASVITAYSTSTVTHAPTPPPTTETPTPTPTETPTPTPPPTTEAPPPPPTTEAPPPPPQPDNCPGGDYTGDAFDGACGQAPPKPDNCPNGDYTGDAFDGSCGQAPPKPDNCPGGDYSGNAFDGSCGQPPKVDNTRTLNRNVSCNGPVVLTVTGRGAGQVTTRISGAGSGSGSPVATASGPAGVYSISVTDTGGSPGLALDAQGAICSYV